MNQQVAPSGVNSRLIWIIVIVMIVLVLIGLVWYSRQKSSSVSATLPTYSDAAYKFSLTIPTGASVVTSTSNDFTVAFPTSTSPKYLDEVTVSRDTNSLASTVEAAKKGLPNGTVLSETNSLTLGGQPAIKWALSSNTTSDHQDIMIFVVNNSYLYEIMSNTLDPNFNNFLSSFQFTK